MKGKFLLLIISAVIFFGFTIFQTMAAKAADGKYLNKKYGISFNIPKGMKKYTPENPGPLYSLFSSGTLLKLVNPNFTDENIDISCTEGRKVSESNIKELKTWLDANPSLDIPGYQRISVRLIKIGNKKDKLAVEHIFITMQGNVLGKLRQVVFSHRNIGFVVTCGAVVNRYDKANEQFFNILFNSMEFY